MEHAAPISLAANSMPELFLTEPKEIILGKPVWQRRQVVYLDTKHAIAKHFKKKQNTIVPIIIVWYNINLFCQMLPYFSTHNGLL